MCRKGGCSGVNPCTRQPKLGQNGDRLPPGVMRFRGGPPRAPAGGGATDGPGGGCRPPLVRDHRGPLT
eukprot:8541853-Pyramimonas_sp.AAC.1